MPLKERTLLLHVKKNFVHRAKINRLNKNTNNKTEFFVVVVSTEGFKRSPTLVTAKTLKLFLLADQAPQKILSSTTRMKFLGTSVSFCLVRVQLQKEKNETETNEDSYQPDSPGIILTIANVLFLLGNSPQFNTFIDSLTWHPQLLFWLLGNIWTNSAVHEATDSVYVDFVTLFNDHNQTHINKLLLQKFRPYVVVLPWKDVLSFSNSDEGKSNLSLTPLSLFLDEKPPPPKGYFSSFLLEIHDLDAYCRGAQ